MKVIFKPLSEMSSNGYIIYDEKTREAYIIDPGENGKSFLMDIEKLALKIKAIILTHHHGDHSGGVGEIVEKMGCEVLIGEKDAAYTNVEINGTLSDGYEIFVGKDKITIINTPGHTEGGIVLYCEEDKKVFTGDTLFDVEIGRTDLSDGSPEKMKDTMQKIVDSWKDNMEIFPGHGKLTTMADVRKYNEEFLYALTLK